MNVEIIKCLKDNYSYLITDSDRNSIVIDPSESDPIIKIIEKKKLNCILLDEAQFLSRKQVNSLGRVSDELNIPVMCYGIRTDFQGKLFDGSSELLAIADNVIELKTICSECDKKATFGSKPKSLTTLAAETAISANSSDDGYSFTDVSPINDC